MKQKKSPKLITDIEQFKPQNDIDTVALRYWKEGKWKGFHKKTSTIEELNFYTKDNGAPVVNIDGALYYLPSQLPSSQDAFDPKDTVELYVLFNCAYFIKKAEIKTGDKEIKDRNDKYKSLLKNVDPKKGPQEGQKLGLTGTTLGKFNSTLNAMILRATGEFKNMSQEEGQQEKQKWNNMVDNQKGGYYQALKEMVENEEQLNDWIKNNLNRVE